MDALRQSAPIENVLGTDDSTKVEEAVAHDAADSSVEAHTSTELLEALQATSADAPLCVTCGTKMRPAGSCYVCEGCGSTSGCS